MSPMEVFESMRKDAQKGSITEENADEFILNIRKERLSVIDVNVDESTNYLGDA